MDKLIELLDYYVNACTKATDTATRRTFFDQATGAVQMYCYLNLADEAKVLPLWDETYRPKFENLVYGSFFKSLGDL